MISRLDHILNLPRYVPSTHSFNDACIVYYTYFIESTHVRMNVRYKRDHVIRGVVAPKPNFLKWALTCRPSVALSSFPLIHATPCSHIATLTNWSIGDILRSVHNNIAHLSNRHYSHPRYHQKQLPKNHPMRTMLTLLRKPTMITRQRPKPSK